MERFTAVSTELTKLRPSDAPRCWYLPKTTDTKNLPKTQ